MRVFSLLFLGLIVCIQETSAQQFKPDSLIIYVARGLNLPHVMKYWDEKNELPILTNTKMMEKFALHDTIIDSMKITFFRIKKN